ncbi:MAG: YtxH domain-containing protein [Bacteroidota bacterium]
MNRLAEILLAGLAGVAGGLLLGILAAPKSGSETRHQIAGGVRGGAGWIDAQAREANRQIQEAGAQAADQIRRAARDAFDQISPDFDSEEWDQIYAEAAKQTERR